MMFLDHPPSGTTDRWKEGAAMCAGWGITTSHASIWRLHTSYAVEWRARLALQADEAELKKPEALAFKFAEMLALRTCELLANPNTPPATVVSLARVALRQKACALAQQIHDEGQRGDVEWALSLLDRRVINNWEAQYALSRLRKEMRRDGPMKPSPFPFPPALLEYFQNSEPPRDRKSPFADDPPKASAPKTNGPNANAAKASATKKS
jgi:hypothetical protein